MNASLKVVSYHWVKSKIIGQATRVGSPRSWQEENNEYLESIGMNDIRFPIVMTDNGGFQLAVDLNLYCKNAIVAAMYKYTDKYYVYQETSSDNNDIVLVTFEAKEQKIEENVVKQFCNELADQQLREITTEKYGHIRDLIVEEAFKPVTK